MSNIERLFWAAWFGAVLFVFVAQVRSDTFQTYNMNGQVEVIAETLPDTLVTAIATGVERTLWLTRPTNMNGSVGGIYTGSVSYYSNFFSFTGTNGTGKTNFEGFLMLGTNLFNEGVRLTNEQSIAAGNLGIGWKWRDEEAYEVWSWGVTFSATNLWKSPKTMTFTVPENMKSKIRGCRAFLSFIVQLAYALQFLKIFGIIAGDS